MRGILGVLEETKTGEPNQSAMSRHVRERFGKLSPSFSVRLVITVSSRLYSTQFRLSQVSTCDLVTSAACGNLTLLCMFLQHPACTPEVINGDVVSPRSILLDAASLRAASKAHKPEAVAW